MNLHEVIDLSLVPILTEANHIVNVSHAVVTAKIVQENYFDLLRHPKELNRLLLNSSLVEHNFTNYFQKERPYLSLDESVEWCFANRVYLPDLTADNPYLWVDTHKLESDIIGVLIVSNKAWRKQFDWIGTHKDQLEGAINESLIAKAKPTTAEGAIKYVEDQVSIIWFVKGEATVKEKKISFRSKIDITEGMSLDDFYYPDCDLYGTLSVVFDVFRRMRLGEFKEEISTYTTPARKLGVKKKKQKRKKQTRTLTHTVRHLRYVAEETSPY